MTETPARISAARTAAFTILHRVASGKGHSDDLLHTMAVNALSSEDRNLTTTLVLGTLRWQLAIDSILRPYLQRPFQEMPAPVLLALRLGTFQLLLLDRIPDHAALNESVELARANGAPHAAGMVNAVLRRVQREGEALKKNLDPEAAHPQWLLDRWKHTYGNRTAHTIAEADQHEPNIPSLFNAPENAQQMDDGSRLIAELTAASSSGAKRILDCCAAPGGKTLVLAARHPEAKIVAADLSPRRLSAMQRRVERAGFPNIETVVADLTAQQRSGPFTQPFQLILCDVPCSGTGTLARNPEIRHTIRPEEFARQAERQRAILSTALSLLAPGGRLIYSTCSLEPEENEDVVRSVLSQPQHAALKQLDIAPLFARLAKENILSAESAANLRDTALRGTTLRTLPGTHATDGFFAALIERPA